MRTDSGRNGIGKIGAKILERPANDAPKPAGREFAGRFVDGNDASDFERCGSFLLSFVGAAFFVDVTENLNLGLDDLKATVAVCFDFAVEREHLSGLEAVLQIGGVEPQTLQFGASLADGELENRHATGAKQT